MIVSYTYNEYDLRAKKCYHCKFLMLDDNGFDGYCTIPETKWNKRLIRERSVTSRKCGSKQFIK